jgi:hypothetical protein
VETPRGSYREGVGKGGKRWRCVMPSHYGYAKGSVGADHDHLDVYVGLHPKSSRVFIVDQVDADSGKFDEHKALIGFASKAQAEAIYKKGFSDSRGADRIGHITEMSVDEFRDWLKSGKTKEPLRNNYARGGVVRKIGENAKRIKRTSWGARSRGPWDRTGKADGGGVGDDFNTRLSPADEAAFQPWKAQNMPNDSGVDYDQRGAYLASASRQPNGHWGDRFKKPNHPTFSDQSQYAEQRPDMAGHWNGEQFIPPALKAGGGAVLSDADVGLEPAGGGSAAASSGPRLLSDADVGLSPAGRPKKDVLEDVAMQVPTGFNSGLASMAGLPVDAMTWALNRLPGVNIKQPFGGSESIKRGLGYLGANPDLAPAETSAGHIARAAGEGAGMMVAPEAALATAAKAGVKFAPRVGELAQSVFGRAESLPSMATNALVGAGGGAAGKVAEDAVPDPYKPLANLGGNLLGGGLTAAGAVGTRIAGRAGLDAAGNFARPFTEAGRERMAADTLGNRSSSREALRDTLDNLPPEQVPGSQPTTFQATGDMGLGALEREVATRNPAEFMQRRAEQNSARVDALRGLEENGSPADVSHALRQQFDHIDQMTQGAVDRATAEAAGRVYEIGGHGTTEGYGAALRDGAAQARAEAKANERALWRAVDPDDSLILPVAGVKQAGAKVYGSVPATARPIAGEEAAIRDTIKALPLATKFADVAALRSRVSTAMREELMTNGQSTAYARLTQLRGAIEKSLDGTIEKTAKQEAKALAAGQLDPSETFAGRLAQTMRNTPEAPQVGSSVYSPAGRQIDVDYHVVPGSSLVTSHTPDMQANPAYPSELQPRDRSRAASELQVSQMTKNLQPERLGPSHSAGEGAPIVGPDGVVESGNARTMAILRAHAESGDSSAAYRQYLESQGFNTSGIPDPVLVRRRTSDLAPADRARFTEEANASPTLSMSASERAASDAKRIPDGALELLRSGEIGGAENRDFVRAFLRSVPERGEEGALVTNNGRLSLDGTRRIQNALLQAGYGDGHLVARLAESGDDSIRGLGHALTDVAGEFAKLRRDITAGHVSPGVDITPDILQAVRLVDQARSQKVPLAHTAASVDAFNPTSPITDLLLRDAYGDRLNERVSRERFASLLRDFVTEAKQQTTEARLFGEPASAIEILRTATARRGGNDGTRPRPGPWDAGQGDGTAGAAGRRPEPAAPGSAGSSAGSADARVLARPELVPNFDKAASERLTAANTATRERVQTFDKGPVGGILRPAGMAGQYRSLDSAVPSQIFKRGPTGFEAVNAYRHAVGDAAAMETLGDYAAASLRQAAMRPDGLIDPARFNTWRRAHSDALRAMPETADRLSTAAAATREIETVAAIRRDALDQYQRGVLGAVLGATEPAEVAHIVGRALAQKDSGRAMRQLVGETRGNPAAREGLRRAVVDSIADRFISNTEAATTGQGLIKSDQFQTFIRANRDALRQVFSEPELNSLNAIAKDLQRANRSVTAVKLPGQSNTAQDLHASLLGKVVGLARHGADAGSGFLGSVASVAGSTVGAAMRAAGMRSVDDLVREAMLNPALAQRLLAKYRPETPGAKARELSVANYLRRNVAASLFSTADERREQ